MALTDAKIRQTKATDKPQKLTDAHGLYLEVRPTGKKLWRYRYRIAGTENVFAIGEYPTIGLADARTIRDRAKATAKTGVHPARQRQAIVQANIAANANTFEVIAREWIERTKADASDYYRKQIEKVLAADVFPLVGTTPIKDVTAAELLKIVQKVEGRGAPIVAANIRQWCSAIFRHAILTLRADSDPAAALKGAIKRPKTEHATPLSREQIKDFVANVEAYGGYRTTVIALRLMLLTFVRTVELRKAEWKHVNLDRAEWRIPGELMKMGEPHLVPLSKQAVALLRELQDYTGKRKYLFPNYRSPDTCMTATTLNRALERMGMNGKDTIGFSAHGFRATASTILNEHGYRGEVIERQLAHAERNKTRASYNQAEYRQERTAMMQDWADMIDAISSEPSK
ncbi:tyrosine-type recombinase/integrase [Pseudogemmobacter sonorensis]|uniref:tyrosine-type recombinase/integrase n=1 Tax=Pseudogemmobacter sonorensis TaxID=2989681 RepID=UPI0036B681B9